ncbi:MAG: hypothetical protein ACP5H5_08395 [Pyrobaculum sp.]
MILAYRRVRGVCCEGSCCVPRPCRGEALAEIRGDVAVGYPAGAYVGGQRVGRVSGVVADAPSPPLRGEGGGWSRLVAEADGRVFILQPTVAETLQKPWLPPPLLLAFFYRVDPSLYARGDWYRVSVLPMDRRPGSGGLVGEEFRIVEPDADYLRLVGRGGDEFLAWDLVLGTLDTGEWVLMGEDGLYLAVREGDKVVVEKEYRGSVFDVRGPPYAPYYPVVPVRWVRERLARAEELASRVGIKDFGLYQPPVDFSYLLKWPAVSFPWEFRAVCGFRPYASARLIDCRKACELLEREIPWCGEASLEG